MEKVCLFFLRLKVLKLEFIFLWKKTDVINKLIDEIKDKTNEFLQPNPGMSVFVGLYGNKILFLSIKSEIMDGK
jgi:hypothetical protein